MLDNKRREKVGTYVFDEGEDSMEINGIGKSEIEFGARCSH